VVSEQVLSFALDIADRVLVIENGEIVRDDKRATVDPTIPSGALGEWRKPDFSRAPDHRFDCCMQGRRIESRCPPIDS